MVLDPHWRLNIPEADLYLLPIDLITVYLELLTKRRVTSFISLISIRVALSFSS